MTNNGLPKDDNQSIIFFLLLCEKLVKIDENKNIKSFFAKVEDAVQEQIAQNFGLSSMVFKNCQNRWTLVGTIYQISSFSFFLFL